MPRTWVPRLRAIAVAVILLSLFAPWFRFTDGDGSFSGWYMMAIPFTAPMSFWPLDRFLLLLSALSLGAAALAALGWPRGFRGPLVGKPCSCC